MKILFLLTDGFGIGGTIRTTFNLAATLADRGHEVEVLSTSRRRDVPNMPLDPRVRLTAVVDGRKDHPGHGAGDPDRGRPAVVYPKDDFRAYDYDLLVEKRYRAYLGGHDADAVIATRPGLIAYAAQFARRGTVKVGQEHLTRGMHRKGLRTAMAPHYRKLDALVTVSQADADDYAAHGLGTRVLFIPNSVQAPGVPPSDGAAKMVVAAGRLVASKRYDVLLRAWAKVTAQHPDWQLRIYGGGEKNTELRALVTELGLHNTVLMIGPHSPIEPEWAKGAVAAVTSDKESFGMTLVEAMRVGVPVVSTDAPYGPREIIADGVDGRLTPVGDPGALADALSELIADPARRAAMAAAALRNSERYDPAAIAERYEQLLTELAARPARRLGRLLQGPARPGTALELAPQAAQPVADTLNTPDGGVEVRLPAAAVTEGCALAWDGDGAGSVPVTPGAPVRLPDLPEGTYNLHLAAADGARQPLLAGLRDTRALLTAGPAPDGGVAVMLPFRHTTGPLAVRVWRRPAHAEMGDVHLDGARLQAHGRLFGAALADGAALELRHRTDASRTHVTPVVAAAGGWRFDLDVAAFAALLTPEPAEDYWDAWLRPGAGAEPLRLGRVLDDVMHKGLAYVLPAAVVGGYTVQPFYAIRNVLSLRVTAPAA
ncbi:glycosyltransferase [Spirilliplanes yamanashiensis]|uniref:Glycosyl transferase family 1 n=1 Tax=Spirilliplanes yamanashiensis TaxID=42233 RepID=A0A8J4DIL9_9ACTN|nr:glycosyltransferase [Spirilliplanes yamanashiensis]MDP9817125.1 glycosyltransferase involved in cell wall biosynthesis [Spirilliplanes yamanashiensis]GIJ03222.1 glycosyl transferase family 1 [Spirilliplanes yamanashiensis]